MRHESKEDCKGNAERNAHESEQKKKGRLQRKLERNQGNRKQAKI